MVFVPSFISKGFFGFSIVQTQEYATLFLGTLGFTLFSILERRLRKDEQEKVKMIGQMSRTSKDLTHSYSYIGEINRKLDIMMNITLGFPESSDLALKRQGELYDSIMEAIHLFGKSDEFMIRFTNFLTGEILKEIKSNKNVNINFSQKNCNPERQVIEDEKLLAVSSPKTMNNIFSCIIIKKKNLKTKNNDDLETIKVIAMQALSLFMFMRKNKTDTKSNKHSS